ncbi:Solute carrier family 40 protein [Gryllus bimaculatus]|nr:Solute carrier family 40 protein [Gryllus bimaculatus]
MTQQREVKKLRERIGTEAISGRAACYYSRITREDLVPLRNESAPPPGLAHDTRSPPLRTPEATDCRECTAVHRVAVMEQMCECPPGNNRDIAYSHASDDGLRAGAMFAVQASALARVAVASLMDWPRLLSTNLGSEHAQQRCVAALRRLRPLRVDPATVARRAAVLVPLCLVGEDVCLLYTLRAAALRHYRGQVSFPGGMQAFGVRRQAASGGSLEATALREAARGRLGWRQTACACGGHGRCGGRRARDAALLPFRWASWAKWNVRARWLSAPHEVEPLSPVPCSASAPLNFRYTQFRGSFALPVFTGGEYRIWGLTAIITHTVLKALVPAVYTHHLPKVKHPISG